MAPFCNPYPPTPVPVLVPFPVPVSRQTGVPCSVLCWSCFVNGPMPMTPFQVSRTCLRLLPAEGSVLVQLTTHRARRGRQGPITPGLAQEVLGGISPLSRRHARLHWPEDWLVGRIGSGAVEPVGQLGPRGDGALQNTAEQLRHHPCSGWLAATCRAAEAAKAAPMCPKAQPATNQRPGRVPATLDALPPRFPIRPLHLDACPSISIPLHPSPRRGAPELLQNCPRAAPGVLQTRNGRAGDVSPGGTRGAAPGCARPTMASMARL